MLTWHLGVLIAQQAASLDEGNVTPRGWIFRLTAFTVSRLISLCVQQRAPSSQSHYREFRLYQLSLIHHFYAVKFSSSALLTEFTGTQKQFSDQHVFYSKSSSKEIISSFPPKIKNKPHFNPKATRTALAVSQLHLSERHNAQIPVTRFRKNPVSFLSA